MPPSRFSMREADKALEEPFPLDGAPERWTFTSAQNLRLQAYYWPPRQWSSENKRFEPCTTVRNLCIVYHGLDAHTRANLLAKQSPTMSSLWGEDAYFGAALTQIFQPDMAAEDFNSPESWRDKNTTESLEYKEKAKTNAAYRGSWLQCLNRCGYAVVGYDMQGHGESEGWNSRRFCANSFEDFVQDAHDFYWEAKHRYQPQTTTVMGISMGGCVVGRLVTDGNCDADAAICLGGMFALSPEVTGTISYRMGSWLLGPLSKVAPSMILQRTRPELVYPEMSVFLDSDPLYNKNGITASMANIIAPACQSVFARGNDMPDAAKDAAQGDVDQWDEFRKEVGRVLLVHNKLDTVCCCSGSEAFHELLKNKGVASELVVINDKPCDCEEAEKVQAGVKNAKETNYLDVWHPLTFEPGNRYVLHVLLAWLKKQTGDSTSCATAKCAVDAFKLSGQSGSELGIGVAFTPATGNASVTGATTVATVHSLVGEGSLDA